MDAAAFLPSHLPVLHATMDGRRVWRLDARPDLPMVAAADGFYVIGMYNPDDLGSAGLSEAILSRFPLQVEVTSDYDAARAMGVPPEFVTLAENLATTGSQQVTRGEPPVWAPQMRELLDAKRMVDAGLGMRFAMSAMIGRCPHPEDVPTVTRKAADLGFSDLAGLRTGARITPRPAPRAVA